MFLNHYIKTWIIALSTFISANGFTQNNDPVTNYNYFVRTLNEHYGLFPYKNINWDSLCMYYSQYINQETSPDTLFFTLCRLAGHLKDKHVWIDNDNYAYNYSIGKIALTARMDSIFGARKKLKDSGTIERTYLDKNSFTSPTCNIIAGKIDSVTGYLSLDWFDGNVKKCDSAMNKAMHSISGCQYLVVDIRNNIGGTDSSSLLVANYLVKTNHCYQVSKIRDSRDKSGYSLPLYWHTDPRQGSGFKKIAVLINRYTISAAETFCLALKDQPEILFIGEPTAGAFSDATDAILPNGWHFSYSIGVWTDCQGVLWEGKGIQPDYRINSMEPELTDRDVYIDQALKILKGNSIKPLR
ncbi:MAG TPA: S41 family peptidase [Bacteroidales bacterium]|nr:S41 family peptidase [Bacteroidales bacterium]